MSKKVADFVMTSLALLVLFALLVSFNPDLRDRVTQVVADPQGAAVHGLVTHAMSSGMAVIYGYAGDHTYLFTFLIAACMFTVLMLRVIS